METTGMRVNIMKEKNMAKQTVLSLEQALALPYCTHRFVQLGWRVIRIESLTQEGRKNPGDPNRYVGCLCDTEDRRAYFIAPNIGKESITLDLRKKEGQEILHNIIEKLNVDVFLSNTLPKRYGALGIDYETLSAIKKDLIWAGISAMGPDYPDTPGYDPALQAMLGYMDLTGENDGLPMLCGIPVIDLKAGDEAFIQVCLALWEQSKTGAGKRIDISMAQAAVSWLITFLPLLDLKCYPEDVQRSGNEHRQFIPTNIYPTSDGFVYLAIGNNIQWERLVSIPAFASLRKDGRETNEGRRSQRETLRIEITNLIKKKKAGELVKTFNRAGLVASKVLSIPEVRELPFIAKKILMTKLSNGRRVRLAPPAADTPFVENVKYLFSNAPRYGQHNDAVLKEAGYSIKEIMSFREREIIA
jgi:crotonobetainyl-CoA:carnitine CoA-transferase CaiB-like acyl-CoA transferase